MSLEGLERRLVRLVDLSDHGRRSLCGLGADCGDDLLMYRVGECGKLVSCEHGVFPVRGIAHF